MCAGMPRRMNRSDRTSITSIALSLRATRIARHSWLNSSSTLSMRYLRPSWVRSFEEVIGPDMIALLRPQPDARTVGQPEPAALGLLMGDLQPLTLDPLVVDCPARLAQQFGDLAAMKNRRPSEKPDEYPQAHQLSPPLLRAGTWTSCARPRRSGSSIRAVIWESHRAYIRQNC